MAETKDVFIISFLMILWIVAVKSDIYENSIVFTAKSDSVYILNNTEEWVQGDAKAPTLIRQPTNMQKGFGLAYDFHLQELIFSDPGQNAIYVLNSTSFFGLIYHLGTSNGVGQMSVDWRGHNIYWTDSVYGWIAMQKLPADITRHNSLETSFRLVVEKYLHTPTGIAVHPHKHYLFWADAGPQPKIERSDLIGGGRSIITWAGLIKPTSLCIDQPTDRLFWTDTLRGTIEYSDFYGLQRSILISNSQQDYYGIAVFRDSLIVTVPSLYNVELYDKATGELKTKFYHAPDSFYSDIVYNSEDQPRQQSEGCDEFDCDHICTHMPVDRGYTCLCDDGYELEHDGITCTADANVLERYILLTNGTTICGISINALNIFLHSLYNPVCGIVSHTKEITKFALDMKENIIFYTDGEDIFQETAFGQNPEHIGSADEVSDLDYNWKTGELIWADKADGKIYALETNVHDGEEREIVEDLTHPSSVAVDPHDRRIYWISKEDILPKLHVREEDGSVSIVGTSFLNDPKDLEYDRLNERLLWSDGRGHIGMINVDGSNERKIDVVDKQPEALSVFKKYVICSDDTADNDVLTVIQEPEDTQWVVRNPLLGSTYTGDVHVYDSNLQLSDLEPCEENNGGCEQLCLPQENNRCACDLGYELDTDGTSCITTISGDNFYIVTDTLYKAIYQLDTDGENIHVIEIEKDNDPTSVSFDSGENILYWIDSRSKSLKMKDMHSSRETSLGIDVSEHSSVAVDVTGGNAYVTTADKILLFTPSNDVKTLLEGSDLKGQPGKIALKPSAGVMIWVETGASTRIVKANMDGTTMKEVINDDIDTPTDIVIDHSVDDANIMYWSDSGLHKIEKVDLDSLTPSAVYQNQELEIIAIDVKDDFLFFIAEGHRKIIRIDKNTGSGYQVVKESALLGQLSTLYVWKPAPQKHDACSDCTNGGCSAICLPRRDGRTCACADGISLGSDDKTCNNVDRCDTEVSGTNIKGLDPCCVPISNKICDYTCDTGYQKQPYSLLCKANGRWNMSLTDACIKVVLTTPLPIVVTASSSNVGVYAGVGGGVAAVLVLGIVFFVIYRRKKNRQIKRQRLLSIPSIGDVNPSGGSLNSQSPVYNDSMFRPDLPPRGLTPEEEADGGQYSYLDEAAMCAKTVDLPPEDKEKDINPGIEKGSQPSGRYSKFPQRQSDYTVLNPERDSEYLCPYPAPDYDTDYQEEGVRLPFEDKQCKKYPEGGDTYLHGVSFSKKPSFPNLPQKGPEHINQIKLPSQNGTISGSRQKSAELDDSGYMVAAATGSSRNYGNPGYMTGFITKNDSMIPPKALAPQPPMALPLDNREDRFGDSRL